MKVYQTLDKIDPLTNKFYKEWELPDGFQIPMGYVLIPPTDDIICPRFSYEENKWVEDENVQTQLVRQNLANLIQENNSLKNELLDMQDIILGIYEGVSDETGND